MSVLHFIARDMRAAAIRNGACIRELMRGLRMELTIEAGPVVPAGRAIELTIAELAEAEGALWVLTLSRPNTVPSRNEIEIVRDAFDVPAEIEAIDRGLVVVLRWPMN